LSQKITYKSTGLSKKAVMVHYVLIMNIILQINHSVPEWQWTQGAKMSASHVLKWQQN